MQTSMSSSDSSAPPPLTFELELQLLLEKYEKDKETALDSRTLVEAICNLIAANVRPHKPSLPN